MTSNRWFVFLLALALVATACRAEQVENPPASLPAAIESATTTTTTVPPTPDEAVAALLVRFTEGFLFNDGESL